MEQRISDLKSRGKEAFGKGDYLTAMYFYGLVNSLNHLIYVLNVRFGVEDVLDCSLYYGRMTRVAERWFIVLSSCIF